MKLLGSSKNKIPMDENGENDPYIQGSYIHLLPVNGLVNDLIFHPKFYPIFHPHIFIFKNL